MTWLDVKWAKVWQQQTMSRHQSAGKGSNYKLAITMCEHHKQATS